MATHLKMTRRKSSSTASREKLMDMDDLRQINNEKKKKQKRQLHNIKLLHLKSQKI